MLYFKKKSKRQSVSIYTHRTKTSSSEAEVTISPAPASSSLSPAPAGSSLLQLSVLQGKKKRAHSLFFCEKKWKIFTFIYSFVYVTYVMEETFIGFPSPPGESELEPQLKLNRLALEKKRKLLFCTYIFFRNGKMKTVKWSLKKKTILKKNRVNSLPFCTLLLMMTVKRKKVIVFILK